VAATVLVDYLDYTQAIDLALDATHVYWTDRYLGRVWRVAKAGGQPEELARGLNPNTCLVEGSELWVSGAGAIVAVPVTGGAAREVAARAGPLVRGPDGIYIANPVSGLFRIRPDGGTTAITVRSITGSVGGDVILYTTELDYRVARTDILWKLGAGGPVELARLPGEALRLARAGSTILVDVSDAEDSRRTLYTVPLDGGPVTSFMHHDTAATRFVVDERYLWWTSGGELLRTPVSEVAVERHRFDRRPSSQGREKRWHSLVADGDTLYWISEQPLRSRAPVTQIMKTSK
jgi:hypothetical protein